MIRSLVQTLGPRYALIAGYLPGRTEYAIRNRWQRLVTNPEQYHRGTEAGPDGTSKLSILPQDSAEGKASRRGPPKYRCSKCGMPKKAHICLAPQNLSTADQARLKKQVLDDEPNAGTRSVWAAEEDRIIFAAVAEIGPKWAEVAARLPGRTDHATRNRYHRLTSRGAAQPAPL